ncbi:carbon monoxide dehydrogenase [Azorhizophilus paspali]|uniref:Carbon monoxide dehydrogenase n=1 Tax=Azorhizophilus paspali TaxID=69963 RepID=A0ABV6SGZ1_AZOPA
MCENCNCGSASPSIGHVHAVPGQLIEHEHEHIHADGTVHTHLHVHLAPHGPGAVHHHSHANLQGPKRPINGRD